VSAFWESAIVTYRGTVKGKTIELSEALPYPEGQCVDVSVVPHQADLRRGSSAALLKLMDELGPADPETMDQFDGILTESRLPMAAPWTSEGK
jgi:hypothetical protein